MQFIINGRIDTLKIWRQFVNSKLPAKKPTMSLGLVENYTSSTRQTFVGQSEIIGTSRPYMAPIPYFKMTNTFVVLSWWSQVFKLVQTHIIDFYKSTIKWSTGDKSKWTYLKMKT